MATADISPSLVGRTGRLAQIAAALRIGKLPVVIWLYLLTIAAPVGFSVGPLSLSGMRVLLILTFFPLIFMLLSKRAGPLIPTDILFALHILWATLAIAVNNPSRVVENMGSTGIEFAGGYLLGRVMIRTPEQFMALCRALFLLIALLLPFALIEVRTGKSIPLEFIRSLPGLETFSDVNAPKRLGLERPQSVFAHPIHYGVFSSLMFSMAFIGFRETFSTLTRFVVSGLIALSVFLSLSSGALLSLILQLGLISWAFVFRGTPRRWHLLVALIAVLYVVIDLLSNRTPVDVFMTYATFSAQTAFWRRTIFEWGMINVWANPIFGLGLNNWVRPSWMNSGSMDNFWLVMTVRYGIPGFLLLAIGYLDLIRRIARRDLAADPAVARLRLACVITFLGLTFSLSTVHIWTAVYSFTFFLVGAVVWLVHYEPRGVPAPAGTDGTRREAGSHARAGTVPAFSRTKADKPSPPRATAPFARTWPTAADGQRQSLPDAPPERQKLRFTRFAPQDITAPEPDDPKNDQRRGH